VFPLMDIGSEYRRATVGPGTLGSHAILSFDGLPSGFGSDNRGLVPAIPAIACFMGHTWSKR
jgi:hypothetical protein